MSFNTEDRTVYRTKGGRDLSTRTVRHDLGDRMTLMQLGTRPDRALAGAWDAWLDANFTASECLRTGAEARVQRFIDTALKDAELMLKLGYETVIVPGEDIVTTPGLLAAGEDEEGRDVTIAIGYSPSTGQYVLDIEHDTDAGRESLRVTLYKWALADMTNEIKLLRKTIRERK